MSFSGPDTITVQSVGEATAGALLAWEQAAASACAVHLGNGFVLRGEKILLIGGGVGTAPLAFLGEQARGAGIGGHILAGLPLLERTSSSRIRFEALGDTIITTDDGSAGHSRSRCRRAGRAGPN